jgi:hypothetical protein
VDDGGWSALWGVVLRRHVDRFHHEAKRARLAVHAGRLAKLLLEHGAAIGGEWHTDDCWEYGHGDACEENRAVLKAAGVLP